METGASSSSMLPSPVATSSRRSFLPQRGGLRQLPSKLDSTNIPGSPGNSEPLKEASPAIPASKKLPEAGTQASGTAGLRPRSTYRTSAAVTKEQPAAKDIAATSRITRPETIPSSSRMQAPSNLGRSHSLRRPNAASQNETSSSARSHARTQSTSTHSQGLPSTADSKQVSRPKSLIQPRKTAIAVSQDSKMAVSHDPKQHPSRLVSLKRSTSTRSKPASSEGRPRAPTAAKQLPDGPLELSRKRTVDPPEEAKIASRPAFSTLQQHYTPKKIAKAPTSTFLRPQASETSSQSLPADVAALQTELLQLHLLHVSSDDVERQWTCRAKEAMRGKFDEVTAMHALMLEDERQAEEQRNLRALHTWNGDKSSSGFIGQVQVLQDALNDIPSLLSSGGRLARHMSEFQHWIACVEDIWAARSTEAGNNNDLGSAESLGDSWKAENAALTRKLTSLARGLERLSQPTKGSSIANITMSCIALARNMLEEVQTMQAIEKEVVAQEEQWVEAQLTAIAEGFSAHLHQNEEQRAWCL